MRKEVEFVQKAEILEHVLLHANEIGDAGLFKGKMGICLALFYYSREQHIPVIEEAASYLLEQVIDSLTKATSIAFTDGLSGIGWGIEYLLQQRFMDGNSSEILTAVDEKLEMFSISRLQDLSLETGLEGLLHYLIIHSLGVQQQNGTLPFSRSYREELLARCQQVELQRESSDSLKNLATMYEEIMNTRPLSYEMDIYQWIKPCDLSLSYFQLGLDGYAGKLLNLLQ